MSSVIGRVAKNTGWLYAKMAVTVFVTLWTTRLVLNSLGESDYGIFNLVGGAIGMLGFLNAALATATQRFMSYSEGEGDEERKKTVFNVGVVLHLVIAAVAAVLLILFGILFFKELFQIPEGRTFAAKIVYGSLVVSTVFSVMTVPYDALLNAHENMRYFAVVGILESALKLAVAFICVKCSSDKLIVYGVLMAVIPLITLSIMRLYCKRHYSECVFRPSEHYSSGTAREMAGFAGWYFVGCFSGLVGQNGLSVVANHFFSTVINAAMAVTTQLQGQLMALSTNMQKSVNPVIVKSEGCGERDNMLLWSVRGCKYSYILLSFPAIPLLLEPEYFLTLWLKNVPEWTVILFIFQMIRSLVEMLTISFNTSLSAVGEVKEFNIQTAVLRFAPLVVLWFMFKAGFKPYWVYLIMIIVVVVEGILKLGLTKRYCSLSYRRFFRDLFIPAMKVTAAMLVFGTIPLLLLGSGFLRFVLVILCSWTALALSLGFPGVLDPDEKDSVLSFLKKFSPSK